MTRFCVVSHLGFGISAGVSCEGPGEKFMTVCKTAAQSRIGHSKAVSPAVRRHLHPFHSCGNQVPNLD